MMPNRLSSIAAVIAAKNIVRKRRASACWAIRVRDKAASSATTAKKAGMMPQ